MDKVWNSDHALWRLCTAKGISLWNLWFKNVGDLEWFWGRQTQCISIVLVEIRPDNFWTKFRNFGYSKHYGICSTYYVLCSQVAVYCKRLAYRVVADVPHSWHSLWPRPSFLFAYRKYLSSIQRGQWCILTQKGNNAGIIKTVFFWSVLIEK